jgi:hypothetical protein
MRLIRSAPLAAAILLAACGGNADTAADAEGDAAGADNSALAGAAGGIRLQPGLYRTSFEQLEFNVPGMSDAVKQQMQATMGGAAEVAKPITYCFTPEQAAANGPEEMAKKMAEGNCTVARFDVSGGSISSEMQCTGADGVTTNVLMDGQMTPTGSTMTMTQKMQLRGDTTVEIKSRVTTERVGDCPA